MTTECPIDKKQTALEKEFRKLSLRAKKLILTCSQFRLFLPCHVTFSHEILTKVLTMVTNHV